MFELVRGKCSRMIFFCLLWSIQLVERYFGTVDKYILLTGRKVLNRGTGPKAAERETKKKIIKILNSLKAITPLNAFLFSCTLVTIAIFDLISTGKAARTSFQSTHSSPSSTGATQYTAENRQPLRTDDSTGRSADQSRGRREE